MLILGYGKEGQSTYKLLRSYFPDAMLSIADSDEDLLLKYPDLIKDTALNVVCGAGYLASCSKFDLVIKSPGIPYDRVRKYCDADVITSQTDLFLQAYADRVTGITGTKGKSTTATLINHLLKTAGRNVMLSGNIGIPPLSLASEINDGVEVVFEMSSHQLEHISIAPKTAVILNIFPEHLDHYKDFTAYKMAKFNISRMQDKDGLLIYNADDPFISELLNEASPGKQLLAFSLNSDQKLAAYIDGSDVVVRINNEQILIPINSAVDLPGRHNLNNMMAALLVCVYHGLNANEIIHGLGTYKRLEHRLEYAGTYAGIKFYNDSIATIPEACIEALRTLEKVDLLILGGYDRGLDYDILYQRLFSHSVPYLVFMGDAGARMYKALKNELPSGSRCFMVNGMDGTFKVIKENLKEGDVCLLSPAAASYGMFRDFEERGEVYKKMAAGL